MAQIYLALCIALMVYGQVIFKWQVNLAGDLPAGFSDKVVWGLGLLIKPWVISSYVAALLSSILWMMALTKLELSVAYPVMGLTFVLVLFSGALFFHEPLTPLKIAGTTLIVIGIALAIQG